MRASPRECDGSHGAFHSSDDELHKAVRPGVGRSVRDAVDGSNPANQLRLVVYPIIYRVFSTIQTVVGNGISEASTVLINVDRR